MTSRLGSAARTAGDDRPDTVHQLRDADLDDVTALVDADPIVNAVLAARLAAVNRLEPTRLGGRVFGTRDPSGRLTAACFVGGNLLPVGGGPQQWTALATVIGAERRVCTSIVGRADAVHAFWQVLVGPWGPCRAFRERQPLLVLDPTLAPGPGSAVPRADERVRPVRPDEAETYLPAAAAMFAEELGLSPYANGQGPAYRARTNRLIAGGRALAVIEAPGEHGVLFKADLGAVTSRTCQVQGVWVRPDARGRGIGTPALAAVVAHGLSLAPTVSLYVNDFNFAARRMYAKLGMREVGSLATVLF